MQNRYVIMIRGKFNEEIVIASTDSLFLSYFLVRSICNNYSDPIKAVFQDEFPYNPKLDDPDIDVLTGLKTDICLEWCTHETFK